MVGIMDNFMKELRKMQLGCHLLRQVYYDYQSGREPSIALKEKVFNYFERDDDE